VGHRRDIQGINCFREGGEVIRGLESVFYPLGRRTYERLVFGDAFSGLVDKEGNNT